MKLLHLVLALSIFACMLGCSNTTEGAKKDMEIDSEKASAKLKEGMNSAGDMAANAGNSAKEAGKNIEAATVLTTRIKNAINADKDLNDSRNVIDVDSTKDLVTLNGHVWKAVLKDRAATIASDEMVKAKASQELKNNLTVQ